MKRIKKFLLLLLTICLITFTLVQFSKETHADAGNFRGGTSYSRGGSSHFSGGSSSSRSRRDSSSFGSRRGNYSTYDDDDDYDFGFFPFSFFGFSGMGSGLIIFILILIIYQKMKGKKINNYSDGFVREPNFTNLEKLYKRDPNFREDILKEKIARVYVEMQNAWQEQKWDPMRAYLSPQLYTMLENQLRELISSGRKNIIKDISVLNVELFDYEEDDDTQHLYVMVETRVIDYTIDNYNNVVSGDPNKEVFMGYGYHLVRPLNATAPQVNGEIKQMKCPSCGAPIDINRSAKCEYCGTIIEAKDYDWVISNIEGLYQK